MKSEFATLLSWLDSGHRAAMATVVATWGSSPRPVGSILAVRDDGLFEGSVSGGCVEGAVIEAALEAVAGGAARDLSFGVGESTAWNVGLACGGKIRIYVEPLGPETRAAVAEIVACEALRKGSVRSFVPGIPGWRVAPLTGGVAERSRLVTETGAETFLHVLSPPPRLFVVGAVHIAQFLAPMARMSGLEVMIVDPRTAFASSDRFGEVRLLTAWPEQAFAEYPFDEHTALVTLTHDAKLDDPALTVALRSHAFYIAALGSQRTQASRLERLRAVGFDEDALRRVNGPAGLAIGALSPAEIAVSIMAQMVAARRQGLSQRV